MLNVRSDFALVTLADGRVLAAGGRNGTVSTRTAEIYDPVANRWQAVAPTISTFQTGYGVLLSDGRVAVSGNVSDSGASNGIVDVYTPATNTWARLTDAGSVGIGGFVVTHETDGRLYAIARNEATAYRYDLTTRTWSMLARFSGGRFASFATVVRDARGMVHVFGDTGITPTIHAIYSPTDDRWMTGPALIGWRYHTAGVLGPDGRIYLSGGYLGAIDVANDSNEMRAFDSATNTFLPLAPMPMGRAVHRMTLLPGGQILVAGGQHITPGRSDYLNTTAIYTIATNTWR